MKTQAIVACLAILVISAAARADETEEATQPVNDYLLNVEAGQAFPTASLPDLDGKPHSIADYRGKKLVLHIFASW